MFVLRVEINCKHAFIFMIAINMYFLRRQITLPRLTCSGALTLITERAIAQYVRINTDNNPTALCLLSQTQYYTITLSA